MNKNDMFPSKNLKASDLNGKAVVVTITEVTMEKLGDDEKPVVHFRGKEKGLVLNRVNSDTIAMVLGTDETDEWTGGKITLYPTKTDFQGKRVDCIRVEDTPPGYQRPPTQVVEPKGDDRQIADDDVPF